MPEAMDDIVDSFESLLESAVNYGKTGYNIAKPKSNKVIQPVYFSPYFP